MKKAIIEVLFDDGPDLGSSYTVLYFDEDNDLGQSFHATIEEAHDAAIKFQTTNNEDTP